MRAQPKAPPPLPLAVRMPWMAIALGEKGIKERAGKADHPRILEYLSTVMQSRNPLLRDSTPWCSAFVNWCLREAFPSYHGQRARARAWMTYGKPVAIDEAEYGDIVVVQRGIPGVGGHVAFFVQALGESVELFGGNQRNSVCQALYPKSKILAVRRPTGNA